MNRTMEKLAAFALAFVGAPVLLGAPATAAAVPATSSTTAAKQQIKKAKRKVQLMQDAVEAGRVGLAADLAAEARAALEKAEDFGIDPADLPEAQELASKVVISEGAAVEIQEILTDMANRIGEEVERADAKLDR